MRQLTSGIYEETLRRDIGAINHAFLQDYKAKSILESFDDLSLFICYFSDQNTYRQRRNLVLVSNSAGYTVGGT